MTSLDIAHDIQYILVNTGYNDRVLKSENDCAQLLESMVGFVEGNINNDNYSEDNDLQDNIVKKGDIHIIPPCSGMEYLYTRHSGYTTTGMDGTIYKNSDKITEEEIQQLGLDDSGCFVFKFDKIAKVGHLTLLTRFIKQLTDMDFCAGFKLDCLDDILYDADKKAITFVFDTESG